MLLSRKILPALCLLGILGLAACDSSTEPLVPEPLSWSAALVPEAGATLTGSLSAQSSDTGFTSAIQVEDGAENAAFLWHVGEGAACDLEARIGDEADYPALETDENGTASAEATVAHVLDAEEAYHVVVLSADGHVLMACGELVSEE